MIIFLIGFLSWHDLYSNTNLTYDISSFDIVLDLKYAKKIHIILHSAMELSLNGAELSFSEFRESEESLT